MWSKSPALSFRSLAQEQIESETGRYGGEHKQKRGAGIRHGCGFQSNIVDKCRVVAFGNGASESDRVAASSKISKLHTGVVKCAQISWEQRVAYLSTVKKNVHTVGPIV